MNLEANIECETLLQVKVKFLMAKLVAQCGGTKTNPNTQYRKKDGQN